MSGKKAASSSSEKRLRRELEVLKSQLKVVSESDKGAKFVVSRPAVNLNTPEQPKAKEVKYTLPINHIKRDLSKTVLFAVFAIGVLVVLSVTKVSF